MTSDTVRSRVIDQPMFFPSGVGTYFGLVSMPPEGQLRDTGVILLSGTTTGSTTIGRNRMWVTLGRDLAEKGYPAIRIDYAGLGESLSGGNIYDLDSPALNAFREAVAVVKAKGVQRVVVIGTCYGSRTAVTGAAEREDVAGVMLLAPPIRTANKGDGGADHLALYASTGELAKRAATVRTLRKLFRMQKARRVARKVFVGKVKALFGRGPAQADGQALPTDPSPSFLEPFRTLAQRRTPMLVLFGEDDIFWTEWQTATDGRLGRILERAGDGIRVETVPGIVRGFTSLRIQSLASDRVIEWVEGFDR